MRKIITSIAGILLIGFAIIWGRQIVANKKIPKPIEKNRTTSVFTTTVENTSIPISINTSGNLSARRKIALFSEVQGLFERSAQAFKPGVRYSKGSILMQLNSDELRSSIRSQKSTLFNQLAQVLPDLQIDFPDAFSKWQQYIQAFDVDAPLQALPKTTSQKEKLFIASRNISSTYYAIQNLEDRLAKYTIRAPWSGILTEAMVTKGTLIRPGQPLGEFIDPSVYELEVAVNTSYADFLKVGKSVELFTMEKTKSWQGKVVRLNSKVDQATQSISVFIEVRGEGLKEGMYLEVEVQARAIEQAFELSRKLLVDNSKVFVLEDSLLDLASVDPVYFKEKTVIVQGLKTGAKILSQPVPGAYSGMLVKESRK